MKVAHSDLFSWAALELTWRADKWLRAEASLSGLTLLGSGRSVGSRRQPPNHLSANEVKGKNILPSACFPPLFSLSISPLDFPKIFSICKCVKCNVLKHNTATYETQQNYSNQNYFNEEKTVFLRKNLAIWPNMDIVNISPSFLLKICKYLL